MSIIAPNSSAILEAHFAVPGAGGVLHTINTRLDATTIAYQLTHCESKVVFVDSEFDSLMKDVKAKLKVKITGYVYLLNLYSPRQVEEFLCLCLSTL